MGEYEKLTIMIVDDHPVFRRGLRSALEDAAWVGTVVEAASVEDAVRTAVLEHVDVVAMDLALPDGSGLDATARICRARPEVAVLILTMTNDLTLTRPLLSAGARGYLLKEVDGEVVTDALHAISQGMLVLGPHVSPTAVTVQHGGPTRPTSAVDNLTPRERAILAELAAGQTNAQIGRRLNLSEKTVRNQLSSIYMKLQVADRTQAALYARESGLGTE